MTFGCGNVKVFPLLDLGHSRFSERRQDPCENKLKREKQIYKQMFF